MSKKKLSTLIKQLNEEHTPPGGWKPEDSVKDEPIAGKTYALTGGPGSSCIANGNSWADSEVNNQDLQPELGKKCS